MEPIINPWIFYLLEVVYSVNVILAVTIIALSICVGIYIGAKMYYNVKKNGEYDHEKKSATNAQHLMKMFHYATWLLPLMIVLLIILPSRSTLITMLVAKQITYNNVDKAITAGKDLKNELKKDIIDIINSLTKSTNKETEIK